MINLLYIRYTNVLFSQVYSRLQKLLLCLSHEATLSFIEKLDKDYDKDVKSWAMDIEAK